MRVDDFEEFMIAKRHEQRAARSTFWREFAWTALAVGAWGIGLLAFVLWAPVVYAMLRGLPW